jgi:hypothetical protein
MGRGLARTGVNQLGASAQGFLDQRLSDTAIAPGHQNRSAFDRHVNS